MVSKKETVEQELGVRVPDQYSVFLEKCGIYAPPGIEVYGISHDLLHYDGVSCVIGATKMAKKHGDLPHRFLVIHHTDVEDEMICLDTENEKVYSISRVFGDRKIADSFDQWFERDIIGFSKGKRSGKFHGEKIVVLDKI